MEALSTKLHGGVKNKILRRLGLPVLCLTISAAFVIGLAKLGPFDEIPHLPSLDAIRFGKLHRPAPSPVPAGVYHHCDLTSGQQNARVLEELKYKYQHLAEDKFTIAIQTYKRPVELKRTIAAITAERIPSLHEIVIVWNDIGQPPPPDFARNGVPVRHKVSTRNSLNSRLKPDPSYQTQAILLTDDDVYYRPRDLEFVFQAWREAGHDRLTGALARCSIVDQSANGPSWKYDFCSRKDGQDNYSMVLTNLAFSHIAFMEYYSSDDPVAAKLREYVDEHFNCEDIAMNFVHSYLTRTGPLLVTGNDRYVNFDPKEGISRKPGHLAARSRCLNDFAGLFGCMPLVNVTTHASRGVVPL